MTSAISLAIPIVVFFVMTIVGLDLTPADFRQVARRPGLVLGLTLAQSLLIPLVALSLVQGLSLKPTVAVGLLLLAVCPGGGISNYYTYLARASTALSIALTCASSLAAAATLPALLALLVWFVPDHQSLQVPLGALLGQLLLLMTVPVLLGMGVRYLAPSFTQRNSSRFRRLGVVAVAGLVVLVVSQGAQSFARDWSEGALASALLVLASMAVGYAVAAVFALSANDRLTVLIEFGVRNAALPTAMAVSLLHQFDLAVMMAIYFLTQVPLMFLSISLYRLAAARRSGLMEVKLQQP
ncbi:MAG: bile acid:sodium symporter family protein [Candidatus Acidiferrales bacterium]